LKRALYKSGIFIHSFIREKYNAILKITFYSIKLRHTDFAITTPMSDFIIKNNITSPRIKYQGSNLKDQRRFPLRFFTHSLRFFSSNPWKRMPAFETTIKVLR
jgi:hypothetical protein